MEEKMAYLDLEWQPFFQAHHLTMVLAYWHWSRISHLY
jgi:hypothetical protein